MYYASSRKNLILLHANKKCKDKPSHPRECSASNKAIVYMDRDARKSVFGVSELVRREPTCSATESKKHVVLLHVRASLFY